MPRDELKQPLRKRSLGERLWSKRPGILPVAYAVALTGFVGAGTWAVRQPAPFAGEPIVVVEIPAAEEIITASTTPAADSESEKHSPGEQETIESPVAEDPSGFGPETPLRDDVSGSETPGIPDEADVLPKHRQVAVITGNRPLRPAPVDSITEVTTWGPLPRISSSGEKASRVYARKAGLQLLHSDTPKIAIVLGGMGLNKKLTTRAVKDLPPDITLAFAPYGQDLQVQVNAARKDGHEVLLQVPFEPMGYPASNPGPKTLLGDGTEAENIDHLRWHLSRFTGYTGIVNYMGNRFLSMPKALKPVLKEVKSRGLLFVEDGSMALSSTEAAADAVNAQATRAKMVIDAEPSPQAIRAALQLLEDEARKNGMAIGTGSGLEVTIDVLRDWSKELEDQGISLIPVSASFEAKTG